MSMTDRDKKILLLIVPAVLIAAFWFLVLSPKREESATIQEQVETAQSEQQTAEGQVAALSGAKRGFTDDYTTVVRLGKAVPANVDMPSLIVQLDRAARGTDITFDRISTGERTVVATGETSTSGAPTDAQSAAGKTAEKTQSDVNAANNTNQGNADAANGTASGSSATTTAAGLESIPLDFTFNGTFFDLADFFHRMKRFVRVAGGDIIVRGRLMTIDSVAFTSDEQSFPNLEATVHATVFLAPKAEGVNAGASPAGPGSTSPASSGSTSSGSSSGSGSSTPATTAPAATVK